jgi:hypothetical protein
MSSPQKPSALDQARLAARDGVPAAGRRMGRLTNFHENFVATKEFRKNSNTVIGDVWYWLMTPTVEPEHGNLEQLREATYASVKKAQATMEWWYWLLANAILGHPLLSFIGGIFFGLLLLGYCGGHWYYISKSFNLISPYYWYKQYEILQLHHH